MKRWCGRLLSMCVVALLALSFSAHVEARKRNISSTTRATIDGDAFMADDSATGDLSILTRELGRRGVAIPEYIRFAEEIPVPPHPAFLGRLRGSPGSFPPRKPELPDGLRAEHTLSLEGNESAIDLVIGRIESRGLVRSSLGSGGWERHSSEERAGLPTMLNRARGKEVTIVWLDETKDEFLLVREMGR